MGLSPPPAAQSPDSIDQASVPLPGSLSCARSLNTMPYTPISVPIILNTCPLFHNTGHPRLFLHPSLCCWNILFPDLCSQPRYHVPRLYSHITAHPPPPRCLKACLHRQPIPHGLDLDGSRVPLVCSLASHGCKNRVCPGTHTATHEGYTATTHLETQGVQDRADPPLSGKPALGALRSFSSAFVF